MQPPVARPLRELCTPLASLPSMILYECIGICEDGCLHMMNHEFMND
jgi:hypothetical protein